jgi:hypothetical protein
VELVNQTLWEVDARRVPALPLSSHNMDNFVAWHLTKTGTFSVRSAYYIEWESQYGHRVNWQDDGPMNYNPIWEKIWKLRVPNQVKIYLWRIMQETLPCRSVLANRHVPVSAQCPQCKDVKHLLFQCTRAKKIWEQLGLDQFIQSAYTLDRAGQAVLDHILCTKQRFTSLLGCANIPELVAVACWYLWWECW